MREGGKQRTKLPLLECDDHMPRVSREATDILLSKNKTKQNKTPNLKNSERCLVTEKQAIYRKDT